MFVIENLFVCKRGQHIHMDIYLCISTCAHMHTYFTQKLFLITAILFGNNYCIWISQMEVPLEPSLRVQKSALGHDSYFTLKVYACAMHAFQGKAVWQCVNDPYMCVHVIAYLRCMCLSITDESRMSGQVYFYLRTIQAMSVCAYSMYVCGDNPSL